MANVDTNILTLAKNKYYSVKELSTLFYLLIWHSIETNCALFLSPFGLVALLQLPLNGTGVQGVLGVIPPALSVSLLKKATHWHLVLYTNNL